MHGAREFARCGAFFPVPLATLVHVAAAAPGRQQDPLLPSMAGPLSARHRDASQATCCHQTFPVPPCTTLQVPQVRQCAAAAGPSGGAGATGTRLPGRWCVGCGGSSLARGASEWEQPRPRRAPHAARNQWAGHRILHPLLPLCQPTDAAPQWQGRCLHASRPSLTRTPSLLSCCVPQPQTSSTWPPWPATPPPCCSVCSALRACRPATRCGGALWPGPSAGPRRRMHGSQPAAHVSLALCSCLPVRRVPYC